MGKFAIAAQIGDEHLTTIGKVVVRFALLEGLLAFFIRILMRTEGDVGEIVTADLPFSKKVGLLRSLYRYRLKSTEKLAELEKILHRVEKTGSDRNDIVHSVWISGITSDKARGLSTTAKGKGGLRFKFEQKTVKQLEEVADSIEEVAYDLQMFFVHNYEAWFRE